MNWIAPSQKDSNNAALEKRLWDAADQFRANSGLKSQEDSAPVLGLTVLRFAETGILHHQIQNLRQTRDLLLPRLLSGQVNLKEN